MKLTAAERERLTDGVLKIQSVKASLKKVEKGKIPNEDDIAQCLESADESLRQALGYKGPAA